MITVDVVEDLAHLDGVRDRLADITDAAGPVGDTIRGFFATVFDGAGRRTGGWPPLSDGYLAERQLRPVGVQSGGLLRSLIDPTHTWHEVDATTDRIEVGTSAPHGHLFARGRGGQPARPFARPDRQLAADLANTLHGWLLGTDTTRGV